MMTSEVVSDDADENPMKLVETTNEARPDNSTEHANRASDVELAEIMQPGPSSNNIDNHPLTIRYDPPQELILTIESEEFEQSDPNGKLQDNNARLLNAIYVQNNEEVSRLLENGASPNATCPRTHTSACHIAAYCNEEALRILLKVGAERRRFDRMGNTPLHYATCSNSPTKIAMILDFPKGLTDEISMDEPVTQEEETKKQESQNLANASMANVIDALPDDWRAGRIRDFGNYPLEKLGWSALHAASAHAYHQCVCVLLKAGADANLRDDTHSTPLEVAGVKSSDDDEQSYLETLKLLREKGGSLYSDVNLTSVLERALRKGSMKALRLLLDAAAPIREQKPKAIEEATGLRLREQLLDLMKKRPREIAQEGSEMLLSAASKSCSDDVSIALITRPDITYKNDMGDTALHLAVKNGNYDIVKKILDYDTERECGLSAINNENYSLFKNAIVSGKAEIVRLMLDWNSNLRDNLNSEVEGLTPLWYAAVKKFEELFTLILNEQIKMDPNDNQAFQDVVHKIFQHEDYKNEMVLVVNAIAKHNHWELFSKIKNLDDVSVKYITLCKKYALYEAIKHNSREMIMAITDCGADLSKRNEDGKTAIGLIMDHVTKPTEFLTEVLDKCIDIDKNIDNKDCVITIKYNVLMDIDENIESDGVFDHQNTKAKDMKVLEALIETGDLHDQRNLLTHPVVESFLCFKLKKIDMLTIFLLLIHIVFLISLNVYIATIYYLLDQTKIHQGYNKLNWLCWILAIVSFVLCAIVDLCYLGSYFKVEKNCPKQMNRIAPCPGPSLAVSVWIKKVIKKLWCSRMIIFKFVTFFTLFVIFGFIMLIPMAARNDAIRYFVAVPTVSLLSWIYFIELLSWIPRKDYFNITQMYGKVVWNVITVMLVFLFPLVCFSNCFTILLHFKEPFDNPITAIFKTIVSMTEFEYENLVKNGSGIWEVLELRIFFMVFIICISFALMNLMLSFALGDYQELSQDGNQRWIMKQVEMISALEQVFQMWPFSTYKWTEMKVDKENKFQPNSKDVDEEIMKNILKKAQILKETKEIKAGSDHMRAKIDDTFDLTKKISEFLDNLNR